MEKKDFEIFKSKYTTDILTENKKKNIEIVQRYLKSWLSCRNGKMREQEYALRFLFEKYPQNNDLQTILLKVSVLNDFYSTRVRDTHAVAKVIYEMDIDKKLKIGDVKLVKEIIKKTSESKDNRDEYSFASKYCSFHNSDCFPIFDSRNEIVLTYYKDKINTDNFNIEDYQQYIKIFDAYKSAFHLQNFSYKEIDRFNWTLCNTVLEKEGFD